VAFLSAEGNLKLFRFSDIPMHLEEPPFPDLNHDELYQVAIGELNA
jgi:hypothetical protein